MGRELRLAFPLSIELIIVLEADTAERRLVVAVFAIFPSHNYHHSCIVLDQVGVAFSIVVVLEKLDRPVVLNLAKETARKTRAYIGACTLALNQCQNCILNYIIIITCILRCEGILQRDKIF